MTKNFESTPPIPQQSIPAFQYRENYTPNFYAHPEIGFPFLDFDAAVA